MSSLEHAAAELPAASNAPVRRLNLPVVECHPVAEVFDVVEHIALA
jgi:hypothetical protein